MTLAPPKTVLPPQEGDTAVTKTPWLKHAGTVLVLCVWFVVLRPTTLGGPLGLVFVHGTSMQPTYVGGDIVVTLQVDEYEVGDIIAFSVPEARSGLVIHRVLTSEDGVVTTIGDNLPSPDHWLTPNERIQGKAVLRIPEGGRLMVFMAQPFVLALSVSMAVVLGVHGWLGRKDEVTAEEATVLEVARDTTHAADDVVAAGGDVVLPDRIGLVSLTLLGLVVLGELLS